jgi:dihydropteroate synthase
MMTNERQPAEQSHSNPFDWGTRTFVMGILNVSPDSFSGDGLERDVALARERALSMLAAGADIIDVGGQSTRPGHTEIPVEEEIARVRDVIQDLAPRIPVPLSIDTYRAAVAESALDAGASIINDVRGLTADPDLARLAADRNVPVVLMHDLQIRDQSTMIPQIVRELSQRIEHALDHGVRWEQIIIDPGFGFGKQAEMNLELLRRLRELTIFGRPILAGTSRKATIGKVLQTDPDDRLEGTAATASIAIANGADIIRVHDVREMVRVARMTDAIVRGNWCEHTSA